MDARLKETVRRRAEYRCEYCHLPEAIAELPFQFDHVVAVQHGGLATEDNLALACARCNRYKGPNLSGIDRNRENSRAFLTHAPTSGPNILFGTMRVWVRTQRLAGLPSQFSELTIPTHATSEPTS